LKINQTKKNERLSLVFESAYLEFLSQYVETRLKDSQDSAPSPLENAADSSAMEWDSTATTKAPSTSKQRALFALKTFIVLKQNQLNKNQGPNLIYQCVSLDDLELTKSDWSQAMTSGQITPDHVSRIILVESANNFTAEMVLSNPSDYIFLNVWSFWREKAQSTEAWLLVILKDDFIASTKDVDTKLAIFLACINYTSKLIHIDLPDAVNQVIQDHRKHQATSSTFVPDVDFYLYLMTGVKDGGGDAGGHDTNSLPPFYRIVHLLTRSLLNLLLYLASIQLLLPHGDAVKQ
jgi:hypothetical protein